MVVIVVEDILLNELEKIKAIQSLRYEVYRIQRKIDGLKLSKFKLNMKIRILELLVKIIELG